MRIVLSDFMSLDGVVQAPGLKDEDPDGGFAHGGWSLQFFDEDTMAPVLNEVLAKSAALLFGRRTWQVMAATWPGRAGDPFADRLNEIRKYVASRTLTEKDLDWNNTNLLPSDDLVGEVAKLRALDGGDIMVMGSTTAAKALISAGLVDEYRLMIEPVILGGGKRLFPEDGSARPIELVRPRPAVPE